MELRAVVSQFGDGAIVYVREASEVVSVGDGAEATQPAGLMYEVGGRLYPMQSHPTCNTCNSFYRPEIDRGLVAGRGYAAILRTLPEDHGISLQSISNHCKTHLPSDPAIRRAMLEARAESLGRSLDDEVSLVDPVGLLSDVVRVTYEGIANGTLKPSLSNGLRAANTLIALQQFEGSSIDAELAADALAITMQELHKWFPSDEMQKFMAHLNAHPEVVALLARRTEAIAAINS